MLKINSISNLPGPLRGETDIAYASIIQEFNFVKVIKIIVRVNAGFLLVNF